MHRQFPMNGWATWVTLKGCHSATAGDRQPTTHKKTIRNFTKSIETDYKLFV